MFRRPIVIGLSPNLTKNDVRIACRNILKPWQWKNGSEIQKTENWFEKYFNCYRAVSFNSGRSALLAILESLDFEKNSEVLIQAFTCVAVPNSIIWANLKPVFVDIDNSMNLDIKDAKKKLTKKTKALIVQHTFGIPAKMDEIINFCKSNNLILIEDCAHALGGRYENKLLGNFGDAAFFSFGRDKIISSVFGGMAITNNKILADKIAIYHQKIKYPSNFWIFQQLLHPVISFLAIFTYNFFNLGKIILYFFQKLNLISFPVYNKEKNAEMPNCFPKKFPNSLAEIANYQLLMVQEFNKKRREIANQYYAQLIRENYLLPVKNQQAVYLRFNLLTDRAQQIRFSAKKKGIILGKWYENIIDPKYTNFGKIGYELGSCVIAEKMANKCLNLPTYPNLTKENIGTIVNFINNEQT